MTRNESLTLDVIKAFVTTTVLLLAAYGAWSLIAGDEPADEVGTMILDPLPLEIQPAVYVEPPADTEEDLKLQEVWRKVNAGEIPLPVEIDG
jgi:hypothetical protein